MVKKPIIGIVSRIMESSDLKRYFYCVEEVFEALVKSSGIPLLILPASKDLKEEGMGLSDELENILNFCDGFIVPGGDTWSFLDEIVINYAISHDKPLLGICLGMQVLSKVLSGNKMMGVDTTVKNKTYINHMCLNVDAVHSIAIKKNTLLYSIIGKENIIVNSRHNYNVPRLCNKYINALSPDGIIEGVELFSKKFILGVQWHPESLYDKDENSKKLFAFFIRACLE